MFEHAMLRAVEDPRHKTVTCLRRQVNQAVGSHRYDSIAIEIATVSAPGDYNCPDGR